MYSLNKIIVYSKSTSSKKIRQIIVLSSKKKEMVN
jgi:hypothetical protein